ncbi:21290_t:CDS:2, partial [Gigaspora margarita]
MDSRRFVSIEEFIILQNIERNNGITVFIPQGCHKQLKIIKEFPELSIRVPTLIFNPPIKRNKWNKLSEYEKSRYKLQSE